jgi:hypothetical protein
MIANTLKICPKNIIVSPSLKVSEFVIPLLPFERGVREVNEKMIGKIENCNNICHSIGHIKH